uniref:Uncharacterized protein n=1 Tax=viral metagenome TaxID=1070528 RepID=A0A6M3IT55_9ZZZZ
MKINVSKSWKGFLTESKFYMSYPGYYRNGLIYCPGDYKPSMSDEKWELLAPKRRKKKIRFWLSFPKAFVRFYFFIFKDT